MLWVGGHLVIASSAETFWHAPYDVMHAATNAIESPGPAVVWVTDTTMSLVFGLILDLIIAGIVFGMSGLLKRTRPGAAAD